MINHRPRGRERVASGGGHNSPNALELFPVVVLTGARQQFSAFPTSDKVDFVIERQRLGWMDRLRIYIVERLKKRLKKDRPSTTITMRIPTDVVESLKAVAPTRGFTAYQTLLKSYIRDCAGMRCSLLSTQRADWPTH
jgi:predicted DNA binding CopG/RHH family protein